MTAAIARILLRYIAAALVTYGLLAADIGETVGTDPDLLIGIEVVLGALIGAATETWYYLAKRWGWAT